MPRLIDAPQIIEAAGTKPKRIEEYAGRVRTGHDGVSLARMVSPEGWREPGQRPEFDEYSIVLKGALVVQTEDGETLRLGPTQAIIAPADEWVQYSTPEPGGAEYIAVCFPAFSPDTAHRDEE